MAYTYETRLISARLFTTTFDRCAQLDISLNAAANYGLEVFVKAHQRDALYALGFSQGFFICHGGAPGCTTRPTTLRIRHDYLDYMEMQGLNRNKMVNYAIMHVCSMIENDMMSVNAISECPLGRGIARRNVYTKHQVEGEEGQEL